MLSYSWSDLWLLGPIGILAVMPARTLHRAPYNTVPKKRTPPNAQNLFYELGGAETLAQGRPAGIAHGTRGNHQCMGHRALHHNG